MKLRVALLIGALFWATGIDAQTLTSSQLQTLKTAINADPTLSILPNGADEAVTIATAFNLVASPAFWVWRTAVSRDEYVGSTSVDGTTFNWTGTGYITRAQGERDAFNALFDSAGMANPSRANVRQAVADIFSGATAPAPANRTHLLTVSRKPATRAAKLYAVGTGSTASPAVLGVAADGSTPIDTVSASQVTTARNLP